MKANFKGIQRPRQSGFTLVEIAIVLVIIGLLLGGVLKGQVLIDNARFKNFAKEIDSYRAAVATFQDTYRALPGDLADNTALNAAAPVGNGNGTVSGGWCDGAGEEACMVWPQLRYAGIISGDPTVRGADSSPTHAYGANIDSISTGNWTNGIQSLRLLMQGIPGEVAQRYDNEFDDGNAVTGDVVRFGGGGATTYNITRTLNVFVTLQ